jgi:RNase P/RNase MRP subunit p29
MSAVPPFALGSVRVLQDAIQLLGVRVQYREAGAATAREVRGRVVTMTGTELANSIAANQMRLTLDARDFTTRAPQKGDVVTVDGTRRGVMEVATTHVADTLVCYRIVVQG